MCQHCENRAVRKPFVPVNATIHSEDGLQRHGLQSLRGPLLLREQLPVQSPPVQFLRLQPAADREKENCRRIRDLPGEYVAPFTEKGAPEITKMQKNPNVTVRSAGDGEMHVLRATDRGSENRGPTCALARRTGNLRIPRDSFTARAPKPARTKQSTFGGHQGSGEQGFAMKQQDRNYRLLEYLSHTRNELSGADSQTKSENAGRRQHRRGVSGRTKRMMNDWPTVQEEAAGPPRIGRWRGRRWC